MNIEKIIERAYELSGAKNNAQLAQKMGIASTTFNSRKKRDTVQELIFEWAVKNNYDLNYLFYGKKTEVNEEKNQVLKEIESWVNENDRKNETFKFWFLYELEQKFPDFKEWRRGKEQTAGTDILDLFNPVSQNNSK